MRGALRFKALSTPQRVRSLSDSTAGVLPHRNTRLTISSPGSCSLSGRVAIPTNSLAQHLLMPAILAPSSPPLGLTQAERFSKSIALQSHSDHENLYLSTNVVLSKKLAR